MPRGRNADEMAALRAKAAQAKAKSRTDSRVRKTAIDNLAADQKEMAKVQTSLNRDTTNALLQRAWSTFGQIEFNQQDTSTTRAAHVATSIFSGTEFTRATIEAQAAHHGLDRQTFLRVKDRVVSTALCLAKALPRSIDAAFEKTRRILVPTSQRHYDVEIAM